MHRSCALGESGTAPYTVRGPDFLVSPILPWVPHAPVLRVGLGFLAYIHWDAGPPGFSRVPHPSVLKGAGFLFLRALSVLGALCVIFFLLQQLCGSTRSKAVPGLPISSQSRLPQPASSKHPAAPAAPAPKPGPNKYVHAQAFHRENVQSPPIRTPHASPSAQRPAASNPFQ